MRMWSPTASWGWPGPLPNSSTVVALALGPDSMAMTAWMHGESFTSVGVTSLVASPRRRRRRHSPPCLVDSTFPASVVTAPPAAFWYGSGISSFVWLGHSRAAPARTTTPMAISSPTTTFAANGPSGEGPCRVCEWACECVTRTRVEAGPERALSSRRAPRRCANSARSFPGDPDPCRHAAVGLDPCLVVVGDGVGDRRLRDPAVAGFELREGL